MRTLISNCLLLNLKSSLTATRVMTLSTPLLLCQCAILLVSFEGAVCPFLDFVIENFGIADIYSSVEVEGDGRTGRFIFKKDKIGNNVGQHVLQFHDMIRRTFTREDNYPEVVSFYKIGEPHLNYNIKFMTKNQAQHFVKFKGLPTFGSYKITWARIYSNWRPVIMSYDYIIDTSDIGFKFLDNGDYPNLDARLYRLPFVFRRSDIEHEIRTTPPQTLYLRSKIRGQDFMIQFKSTDNLRTFLNLFPERTYDDSNTADYYFIPCPTQIE